MSTSRALSVFLLAGLASPLAAQSAGPLEIVPRDQLSASGTSQLGTGLSLSGDDLLVRDSSQVFDARAFVFHRNAGAWSQQATFGVRHGGTAPCSGTSTQLSIAGDRLAIGEPFNGSTGRVSIGERIGSTWSPPAYIEDQNYFDFGQAVLLVRGLVLVGMPDDPILGDVEIWRRQPSGWHAIGGLPNPPPYHHAVGALMAASGTRLLVAARDSVKIFEQGASATTWSYQTEFDPPGGATVREIAIDGDVAVLSTVHLQGCPAGSAEVLVYERTGSTWSQTASLVAADSAPPELGSSLAVRGDTIWVGAAAHPQGTGEGAVFVFQRSGGGWAEVAKLSSSPPLGAGAAFGSSVASDGNTLCVGAPGGAAADPGIVQVFEVVSLPPPAIYCTAKTNSLGCLPQMSAVGVPGFTNPGSFELRAANVISHKIGFLLYSTVGSAATPYQGGTLCLAPSFHRTPAQQSGGNPPPNDCSGTYSFDFNARARSGIDPSLLPGVQVWAQYYSRDPGDPFGIGLTDAVTFTIGS